jgi:hypothetical protein
VVSGQELSTLELTAMTAAVLARVLVPGEEKRVRDLTTKTAGHLNKTHEPNHRRKWQPRPRRAEGACLVHFEDLGLSVENEANRTTSRNHRQRFERRIQGQAAHESNTLLSNDLSLGRPIGVPMPLLYGSNL